MKTVNILGSGAREHALYLAFVRSGIVESVTISPGVSGLAGSTGVASTDFEALLALNADLTFVGPEAPLAAGVVDRFVAAGQRICGPTASAARIESSKVYSKAFMERHGIPTPRASCFTEVEAAERYLRSAWGPLVLKLSGLAAGKGVWLPETLEDALALLPGLFEADRQVLIEDRVYGTEVSVLAFTDGVTVVPMPTAQDHKRLWDGNRGPNTGGMGAVAPGPSVDRQILERTIAGLRAEGICYRGVLYAGVMLTEEGPVVLEYNCRFGDPEAQVLLPLLETDLYAVADACAQGTLHTLSVGWRQVHTAGVVLASEGYPDRTQVGRAVRGLPDADVRIGGAALGPSGWVTRGGRVLTAMGEGSTRAEAVGAAYAVADRIQFEGCQLRTDIGRS